MEPKSVYACYYPNEELRLKSSSGAIISAVAEYVFSKNGSVYGVVFSEDCYSASFKKATNMEEFSKIRGSKYVQAKIGNTFAEVKRDLQSGNLVLFTGTVCQVSGLKKFLRKEYENLICIDVICHGVPSPKLWKEYLQYQEKKYNHKIENVNFRCKKNGWVQYGLLENDKFFNRENDPYMLMFLRNYSLRPSCYACKTKNENMSDITVGDFWGINNVLEDFDDDKGCSILLVRTELGSSIFDLLKDKLFYKEVQYKQSIQYNPAEFESSMRPNGRDNFFNDMNSKTFDELIKLYAVPNKVPFKRKLKGFVKKLVKGSVR